MRKQRGITLIEMIILIGVLAIALPPLMNLFGTVATKSARSELTVTAANLAEELMEEIRSKEFVDPDSGETTIGIDHPGENKNNKDTFDDVDDFDGWTDNLAGFEDYTRSVTVYYVTDSDLVTQVAGPTELKRIIVTVAHSGIGAVSLVFVDSPY